MSSGRHRRKCNNDAPDRRLFAALVTDHFQPPQDNLTDKYKQKLEIYFFYFLFF